MFKIFWKSIFITFGWLIVLINIAFFFNMTDIFSMAGASAVGDTSNKYFGISTMINAFKTLDQTPIGKFVTGFKTFVDSVFVFANSLFKTGFPDFFDNNNFWDFIVDILNVLKNILGYLFGIYVVIFGQAMMMSYFVLMIINILYTILLFLGGAYLTDVPQSTILTDYFVEIGHCMTPLNCAMLYV